VPFDLECVGIAKAYGGVPALAGVSVAVEAGTFHALVGPSGCGKSTLLRIVGGHEEPDAGVVRIAGADHTSVPPERRPVHTVFQHHALFPHLRVAGNVEFPLRMRGVPRAERRRRADEALDLVRLLPLRDRAPAGLSGGERQRTALARALVARPRVLLLDEPLGALDLALRRALQDDLRDLQRRTGIAFLHVTHDQEEAFRLADVVAVMRAGRVVQSGAPPDVYRRPATPFVASFLGVGNLFAGRAEGDGRRFTTAGGWVVEAEEPVPGAAFAALREERVTVRPASGDAVPAARAGVVEEVAFLGAATRVTLALAGTTERLRGTAAEGARFARGDSAQASFLASDVRLLPPEPAA
jgi:ABC-type Fe3+/spermidine/putrescine transport system ATPase subunit